MPEPTGSCLLCMVVAAAITAPIAWGLFGWVFKSDRRGTWARNLFLLGVLALYLWDRFGGGF